MTRQITKTAVLLVLSLGLSSCANQAENQAKTQELEQVKQENADLKAAQTEDKNSLSTFQITGKFTKIEMGDCLHLTFVDSTGKSWDLGAGDHHAPFKMSEIYEEFDELKLKEEAKNQTYRLTLAELNSLVCNGIDVENWAIQKAPIIVDAEKVADSQ